MFQSPIEQQLIQHRQQKQHGAQHQQQEQHGAQHQQQEQQQRKQRQQQQQIQHRQQEQHGTRPQKQEQQGGTHFVSYRHRYYIIYSNGNFSIFSDTVNDRISPQFRITPQG